MPDLEKKDYQPPPESRSSAHLGLHPDEKCDGCAALFKTLWNDGELCKERIHMRRETYNKTGDKWTTQTMTMYGNILLVEIGDKTILIISIIIITQFLESRQCFSMYEMIKENSF